MVRYFNGFFSCLLKRDEHLEFYCCAKLVEWAGLYPAIFKSEEYSPILQKSEEIFNKAVGERREQIEKEMMKKKKITTASGASGSSRSKTKDMTFRTCWARLCSVNQKQDSVQDLLGQTVIGLCGWSLFCFT